MAEKKKKKRCRVGYTCGVGQGHEEIFFFFLSKLMKKKLYYKYEPNTQDSAF